MRRFVIVGLVLAGSAILLANCSKKKSAPTAPPTVDPACSINLTTLTFGTVTVGSSVDRQFTVTNTGGGTLSGSLSESCAEFSLVGSSSYSLGAGQAATLTARFTPSSAGPKTCSFATGSTLCGNVTATGTGETGTPVCDLSTTSLAFGSVNYGSSTIQVLTIRNAGGGTLAGSIGGTTTDFTIIDAPTFSLGANEAKSFFISFRPSSGGAQACTLRVDPPGCGPVVCTGFGLLPLSGNCAVRVTSGDTLDFGEVSLGQTAERMVTVRNTSSSYQSSGGANDVCPDFESGFATNFLPGGSGPRPVRFTPTREGLQYCAVELACEMTGSGTLPGVGTYFICRGIGVGGIPSCQVSTSVIDFQQVVVGQTKTLTFQITNTGSGTLSGTAGPSPCGEFSFVGPAIYNLHGGESVTLTLRYSPAVIGHTTSCPLVPVGSGCGTLTLIGEAVGPPTCALSTTLLDFGTVAVGSTKDLTIDLRNTGGGTLCGSMSETCPSFAIVQNASYCVTPPAFTQVKVRFSPTSAGLEQCTITAGANCPSITVRGTGN